MVFIIFRILSYQLWVVSWEKLNTQLWFPFRSSSGPRWKILHSSHLIRKNITPAALVARVTSYAKSDIYVVWWTIIEHLKGRMYSAGLKQCLHVSPLRLLGQSWSWLVEHWAVGGGGGGVVAQFHRRVSRSQPPPPRLPVPHIGDHHPISCWINFTHYQSVFSQTQPTRYAHWILFHHQKLQFTALICNVKNPTAQCAVCTVSFLATEQAGT